MNTENADHQIAFKMAGLIIGALVLMFILQKLGFRFVVSAAVGPRV